MTVTDDNYFDHDADIGIVGYGSTIEKAFINGAEAMFAIMVDDLARLKKERHITIDFEEKDPELAFVTWLNLLLAEAASQDLVLGQFELHRENSHWKGRGYGEPWSDVIVRGTEVKGATLTMLSVKQSGNTWEARCVVDV